MILIKTIIGYNNFDKKKSYNSVGIILTKLK